jgi:hypothetical protein
MVDSVGELLNWHTKGAVSLSDLETNISQWLTRSGSSSLLKSSMGSGSEQHKIYVIKYTAAKFLSDILTTGSLYAANVPGYTWGDAVYVAPIAYPRSTMMYGQAGIVGSLDTTGMTFYDAVDPAGIAYYQDWIRHFPALYSQLTTTVHANHANRELRNRFRGRFGIDCVFFRPDESCSSYVDPAADLWLAVTEWGVARQVAHGRSFAVKDLKWCAIATEAFEPDSLGYRAILHPSLSKGRTFAKSSYTNLERDLRQAYLGATDQVVITEF